MNGVITEKPASTTYPFAQLGYDLMGACFEVHHILGGGLLEEIYQESLELACSPKAGPDVMRV